MVVACATTLALVAVPAGAAQITVNTTTDDVTSGNGLCSLREAIAAVNTPGSIGDCAMADDIANTIVLGPQEYDLTIKPAGADDQSTGDLDVNATAAPLTIEGAGVGQTTINGAALQDRILHVLAGTTVAIEGLTVTGGHAPNGARGTNGAQIPVATLPTAGSPGFDGGGILNEGALTLIGVAVTNNTAGSGGLGGFGQPDAYYPDANGQSGGAGGAGGGIYTDSPGSLTLSNVTVSGNVAGNGGMGGQGGTGGQGLYGGSGGPGGCCGDGGGLDDAGGQVSISASTFTANHAGNGGAGGTGEAASGIGGVGGQGQGGSSGGAIAVNGATASVAIVNSTLDANFGGSGGNGGNGGTTNDPPLMNFPSGGNAGNGSAGGGLFVSGGATATLTNATIDGNQVGSPGNVGAVGAGSPHALPGTPGSAAFGGGIYDSTTPAVTLSDTLLASNELGNCAGNITDGGHNLSFGDSNCPGTGFNRGDPKLGALADNAGPTQTQSLGVGSAAIGAGASCASTDQRGLPRAGSCDIGAYEVTAPSVSASAANAITTTGASLSGAVTANSSTATVVFQFGTSTSYGQTVAAAAAGGLASQAESATLSGLTPGTTYHFRLAASSADGSSSSPDQTFTTAAAAAPAVAAPITLSLSALRLSPARFRSAPMHGQGKGKTGTTISYTDSAAARTTIVVFAQRAGVKKGKLCVRPAKHANGRRCTLLVKVMTLTHADEAGANSLRFNRHLAAGKYRLEVTARAGSQASKTLTAGFTVLKPR